MSLFFSEVYGVMNRCGSLLRGSCKLCLFGTHINFASDQLRFISPLTSKNEIHFLNVCMYSAFTSSGSLLLLRGFQIFAKRK